MKKTILYLEDAADLQRLVGKILSNDGHDVVGVYSAQEAYSALADGLIPDVILMDLSIPEMEPFEFISNIETKYPQVKAPLIVASGHEDSSRIARSLGAVATLHKPFQLAELSMTIAAVLDSEDEKKQLFAAKSLPGEMTL